MDSEELLQEIANRINYVGPVGEDIFTLARLYERSYMFEQLRNLISQKDQANDQIAVETLSWAWQVLAEIM